MMRTSSVMVTGISLSSFGGRAGRAREGVRLDVGDHRVDVLASVDVLVARSPKRVAHVVGPVPFADVEVAHAMHQRAEREHLDVCWSAGVVSRRLGVLP